MTSNKSSVPVDGETRTSRIVQSLDFNFPVAPPPSQDDDSSNLFKTVAGVRCAMPYAVKVAASTGIGEDHISEIVKGVFDQVEATLSNWDPNSEVNKVNMMKVGQQHKMSKMLQEVVVAAKEAVKLTRGCFDPSVAPILAHYQLQATKSSASSSETSSRHDRSTDECSEISRRKLDIINVWKDLLSRGYSSNPKDTKISQKVEKLMHLSQWKESFSVKNNKEYISKKHNDDACLDLDGIAKGFAIDEIAKRLPSPCYVEWGGDGKVMGDHPAGRQWTVAVMQPGTLSDLQNRVLHARAEGQSGPVFTLLKDAKNDKDNIKKSNYLAVLELNGGDAVATSGDCEKVLEKDGKLYSHIINPHLGRLLEINDNTLAQAVIVCKGSCTFADAFATAAISLEDPSKARQLLDPFRTNFIFPLEDFLLFSRKGPRIIRMSIPGVEPKSVKAKRLEKHEPAKVIVIGSGIAGMSAAIEAADARARVIILEKEEKTGGNSAKATSGINGWGTNTQAKLGIPDEEKLFERDTHKSGKGGFTNPSLVRALSIQSAPSIHWLQKKFNIPLDVVSQLGGHSASRTHRAPPDSFGQPVPVGYAIMSKMKEVIEIEYSGRIEIRCGSKVTNFIKEQDDEGVYSVNGVDVECNGFNYEEQADSVIIATGGFGCCRSSNGLMAQYRPDLLGFPTTNGSFAQGDGVLLGCKVGAELIDLDKVQLHPTGFIDTKDPFNPTKILAPEAIRGSGGILVNSDGRRFVNELDLRSVVTKAIIEHCDQYKDNDGRVGPHFAWCIMSVESQQLFGFPALSFYKDKMDLFISCKDLSETALLIGCNEDVLIKTIQSYSDAICIGSCTLTGKTIFPANISPASKDLIVARVTPSIHYTMGGININPAGEVQQRLIGHFGSHIHIRGLFAAGEVTGGVHGNNRLAGNSLLECCVFGRIAGERAATIKQPDKFMFRQTNIDGTENNWVPAVLREIRNTDEKYGRSTLEVRFNLYGALQHSGLDIGQFIGLRGECDGETLQGYFSPITRPDDEGVIGILCRNDSKGGPITELLNCARPGSVMYMCAMGGLRLKFKGESILFCDKRIRRIGLVAGGTGIAPMIQIVRAYSDHVRKNRGKVPLHGLNLIYAAEGEHDLAFMKLLDRVEKDFPRHFRFYVKLDKPPLGWTEGVGFVETHDIKDHLMYPPNDDDLIVICGPPVFENAMRKNLFKVGYKPSQWFSFSESDKVGASS